MVERKQSKEVVKKKKKIGVKIDVSSKYKQDYKD